MSIRSCYYHNICVTSLIYKIIQVFKTLRCFVSVHIIRAPQIITASPFHSPAISFFASFLTFCNLDPGIISHITFYFLYIVTQHTYCKIFSYSHLCEAKWQQQGEQLISSIYIEMTLIYWNDSYNIILTFGPLMHNLLYDTATVTSSSHKQTAMQLIQITVIILSHIRICYLLCHLFPSHYMLNFNILFFSFLLPPIAIFITAQQRTAHDANSTYLTVLLFSHILTKRHNTLLHITTLSTAHEEWTFQKLCVERDNGQPTWILSICI
jgi:hypothetical protein